jgi:hypothetical protein
MKNALTSQTSHSIFHGSILTSHLFFISFHSSIFHSVADQIRHELYGQTWFETCLSVIISLSFTSLDLSLFIQKWRKYLTCRVVLKIQQNNIKALPSLVMGL